ncbi:variable surface protein [Plasmodium gonderi]|uniref:Variable surface protein n=1 Tax=Plasmodium gonderi TaxID=77519 RepID=A0A1Y1JPF2_PLAGO|nr:variable surface protein [Plasmodium gonderi]GAW84319.1 variable surface protein [Plasmodium gonderi]
MVNNNGAKAELYFKDIFPKCKDYYNSILHLGISKYIEDKVHKACNDFNSTFQPNHDVWYSFYQPCIKLGLYLHEVKNKNIYDRIPYCNFFIYELKREVKNKSPKIEKFDDVYEELLKLYNKDDVIIPNVCKEYVSLMNDPVYKIFKMFDELYGHFKDLNKEKYDKFSHVKLCAEKYQEFLEQDNKKYNNSFHEELDKFKEKFHKFLATEPKYKDNNELLNYFLMTPPKKEIKAETLLGDTKTTVKWTSTGVLFFAILIIIFILYNYSAYGSYLRLKKRKIKNLRNRKNKKHYELMNLFEGSQKNIIQNKHNILYNSVV